MNLPSSCTPAAMPAVDATALHGLRQRAAAADRTLLDLLGEECGMHPREACRWLASQFDLPFLEHAELKAALPLWRAWPLPRAQAMRALLATDAATDQILAIVSDPMDVDLAVQLEQAAGVPIMHAMATPEDIHACLNQHEASLRAMDSVESDTQNTTDPGRTVEVLSLASAAQAPSPAVRLVNSTLYDALRVGASDVHLESTPAGMTVRYRIDGVLDEVAQVHTSDLADQVVSRLKVLSDLDIAERRVPQDGSFQVRAQGRLIDLRLSIMPSVHGEDAVIRILDKQAIIQAHGRLSLDALGFEASAVAVLRELAQAAYGMLLVTGPTGSGKTTTLYAALAETLNGRDKVITIEDPVEYQLPGILQIPVNEKQGLTFARGLRSILRHDPDKIMVGEIRDRETAEIAVQSALTGHLVLTTVHANNAYDVFGRFTHMGLDPYALASALNGVWAQRLIRLNCPACSEAYAPAPNELKRFGRESAQWHTYRFRRGRGCGDCRGTGYRGRRGIAEVLCLDDALRERIVQRQSVRQIRQAARARGDADLQSAALALVRDGLTTLEEARRVTLAI